MAKRIAFLITENGVDGRAPTVIVAAFWDEEARDKAFDADKNKAYYGKDDRIVDIPKQREKAMARLDPIDMMVLGLTRG